MRGVSNLVISGSEYVGEMLREIALEYRDP